MCVPPPPPQTSTYDRSLTLFNSYDNFAQVKSDFIEGRLSEADLKTGLIAAINLILEPVRQHFHSNAAAKELLEKAQPPSSKTNRA